MNILIVLFIIACALITCLILLRHYERKKHADDRKRWQHKFDANERKFTAFEKAFVDFMMDASLLSGECLGIINKEPILPVELTEAKTALTQLQADCRESTKKMLAITLSGGESNP